MGLFDFLKSTKTKDKITYAYGYNTINGIKNYSKDRMKILQELAGIAKSHNITDTQILASCDSAIQQCYRIINDCKDLLKTTAEPKVFFSRYDLLNEKFFEIVGFETFLLLKIDSINSTIEYYEKQKCSLEKDLINRCYKKAQTKADSLKTINGKKKQFIKAYNSFKDFEEVMEDESKFYLEQLFETYIY